MVTITRLTGREGSAGGQGRTRRARLGAGPHLPRRAPALSRVRGSRPRQAACFLSPARDAQRAANTDYAFRVFRVQGRAPGGRHRCPSSPRPPRAAPLPLSLAKKTSQLGHEPKGRRMDPGAQATPRPCDPLRPGGSGPGADPESVGPEPCRYLLQEKEQKRHSKVGAGRRQERRTENGGAGGRRGSDSVQGLE